MSLLMDALKKAEREREAQASKEQGGEETETPQELSLDPMERPPDPVSPTDEHDEPWDILGEPGDVSHGFDLSLSDSDLNLDSPPETDPVLEADSAPEPEPSYTPHSLEGMDDIPLTAVPGDDLSVEDTSSTMPSMKAVKASVDRYFDGSQCRYQCRCRCRWSRTMRPPWCKDGRVMKKRRPPHKRFSRQKPPSPEAGCGSGFF